jgi:hypothetical protein
VAFPLTPAALNRPISCYFNSLSALRDSRFVFMYLLGIRHFRTSWFICFQQHSGFERSKKGFFLRAVGPNCVRPAGRYDFGPGRALESFRMGSFPKHRSFPRRRESSPSAAIWPGGRAGDLPSDMVTPSSTPQLYTIMTLLSSKKTSIGA